MDKIYNRIKTDYKTLGKYHYSHTYQYGGDSDEVRVITYNVFSGVNEVGSEERREHAMNVILKHKPNIICLQEATSTFIDELVNKLNGKYNVVKKVNILKGEKAIDSAEESGYIAILTNYDIKDEHWVYTGGYHDDGIVRVDVMIKGGLSSIYNVHLSGGTYGKPDNVILEKRIRRMLELDMLNEDLKKNKNENIIIAGDFNSDANTIETFPAEPYSLKPETLNIFPETRFYPNHQFNDIVDVWGELKKDDPGYTEDNDTNLFRQGLKPGQKRTTRYDQIYIKSKDLEMKKIKMIGTEQCGNLKKDDKEYVLFPSDHYGLYSVFK